MAGIAFRLQKLLTSESYSDQARAYLYSAIISSGPFIAVIIMLSGIKFSAQTFLSLEESRLLMAIIVYIYAFSMIIVSPFYYTVTRYLADKYFLRQVETFTPSFLSVLYTNLALLSIIYIGYAIYISLPIKLALAFYLFFLTTGGIWIAMIYLSAGRSYLWIVWSFLLGTIISLICATILGKFIGIEGFAYGLTIGQALTFGLLTFRIFKEFGYNSNYDFDFFRYFRIHPYLIFIGLFYYLGIWIDKILFWTSEHGEKIHKGIYIFTTYDTAMFLAYLSIIPSMAFFLVHMETSFVKHYQSYFEAIRNRSSYYVIREKRDNMINDISVQFEKYAIFQGVISSIIILLRPQIISFFALPQSQVNIFGVGVLASFLLMGFVIMLNLIFYFDFQKMAFSLCFLLLASNVIFTWITLQIHESYFGFGFCLSCLLTITVSFFMFNHRIKNIDYWIFMRQPIVVPKFKFENEVSFEKQRYSATLDSSIEVK